MPDPDIESLARRAGVDASVAADVVRWSSAGTRYYSSPAVAAMLAQYRREVLEEGVKAIEALRDSHCADTQRGNPMYACEPEGDKACEFVTAWNDAAAALRRLAEKE